MGLFKVKKWRINLLERNRYSRYNKRYYRIRAFPRDMLCKDEPSYGRGKMQRLNP
jgi:hypothetical protein